MQYIHIKTNNNIDTTLVAPAAEYEYYTDIELKTHTSKGYKYALVTTGYNKSPAGYCIELLDYNEYIDEYLEEIK